MNLTELTKTMNPYTSKATSVLDNDWKKNIDIKSNGALTSQLAACENTANRNQFAHLTSLANSVDTNSRVRCGWVYNTSNYTQGRGALGIVNGPLKTTASGTWMWDLNDAKKKYHTDICKNITDCGDIGASMYEGVCGWCTKSGKAVPINNKKAAYPFHPNTACPPNRVVTNASSCPAPGTITENFKNPSSCTPLANGALSRDCLLQKVAGAGCSDAGSMYESLRSGSDNDYINVLRNQQAWSVYQDRAAIPLDATGLKTGKITIADALNGFSRVQEHASSGANGGLQHAARDLCFTAGEMDSYDFCSEISDSQNGPFSLDCLQKTFMKTGGQKTGRSYPSSSNAAKWNAMGTWVEVKSAIQKLLSDTKSSDRLIQENAMLDFYGIQLEDKSKPIPPATSSLSVRLGQHCDNYSGWRINLGVGDWSANSAFSGDASYISVPEGLTATLINGLEQSHVVQGPGEFNFCSRPGFNDNVRRIIVSVGTIPTSSNSSVILSRSAKNDGTSSWEKSFGIGSWDSYKSSHFPSDVTNITVPKGLIAIIQNSLDNSGYVAGPAQTSMKELFSSTANPSADPRALQTIYLMTVRKFP
jgi:hypothetical protein